MGRKRRPAESNDEEQTNGASNLVQQDDNATPAKRAKLTPLSDTKMQDLPNELLENIFVRTVVMEVKGMNLIKRVWKEKAHLMICRLGMVCSHWNNIVTTDIFRNKVHRLLDDTAQEAFRMEILHQSRLWLFVFRVATMKDEMFMLCTPNYQDPFINVCDRNNMVEVKDVIRLPGILPEDMAACSVSNCVYVLNKGSQCFSVLRITKNEEHQFNISPWINDLSLSFVDMRLFVSVNGSLIVLSTGRRPNPSVVSIYSTDGSMQHTITLTPAIHGFRFIFGVIQKSRRSLVLATISDNLKTVLKEIDTTGRIVRRYRSSIFGDLGVIPADANGRIVIAGLGNRAELLDSELNLLDLTVPQLRQNRHQIPYGDGLQIPYGMHYNSERNEIVRLHEIADVNHNRVLTIFRFTGE